MFTNPYINIVELLFQDLFACVVVLLKHYDDVHVMRKRQHWLMMIMPSSCSTVFLFERGEQRLASI